MDQEVSQPRSKLVNFLVIILVIIVTAITTGGGIYLWQSSILTQAEEKAFQQISKLQDELSGVRTEKKGLEEQISELEDRVRSFETEKSQRRICMDSDVNEKPNDIYKKGYVIFTDDKGEEKRTYDECTSDLKQVNEMWCYEDPQGSGKYISGTKPYTCRKGCLDGACKK